MSTQLSNREPMTNQIDQIFTALQTIEAMTMQLGTVLAPLNEMTPDTIARLKHGLEVIERQLALIRRQVDLEN